MSWKMSGRVKEVRCGMNGESITRTDKLVLLVLADYYNEKTKTSWPSLDTLAEECLTSRVSLWRCLKRLETIGLLESQVGRWKEPEYALLPKGDPPSHFNLKHESHFKTDKITFQNDVDHVSKQTLVEDVSIKNQVLAKIEPKRVIQNLPTISEGLDLKTLKEKNEQLERAKEERRLKKQNRAAGNFQKPAVAVPAKVVTKKQPDNWIWFATMFKHMSECNAYSHQDLWPMVDEMLAEISEEEAHERLSIFLDGSDKVTGYLAKDFLAGGWRTIDPEDRRLPRLKAED